MFTLRCVCGARLKLQQVHLGKRSNCPSCNALLRPVAAEPPVDAESLGALLAVRQGPAHVGEHLFPAGSSPIPIGKLPEHPIHLNGNQVSRNHCQLERRGEGWRIVDQGSRNGLFINGGRVAEHELKPGDRIKVGEFELEYLQTAGKARKAASATATVAASAPSSTALDNFGDSADDGMMYRLVEESRTAPPEAPAVKKPIEPGPTCPSCRRELRPGAKICVQCGVDIRTGRAILISQETSLNEIYAAAESVISGLSWLIWVGVYPIASEAFGKRKPWTVRSIAVLTILVSFWFWAYDWTDSDKMTSLKNLMLWSGEAKPDGETVAFFYTATNWGNSEAYFAKVEELETRADSMAALGREPTAQPHEDDPALNDSDEDWEKELAADNADGDPSDPANESDAPTDADAAASGPSTDLLASAQPKIEPPAIPQAQEEDDVYLAANAALPPEERAIGEYRPSQLLTHALLHGDILHLAGNLLFLMVLGTRVNALIGNIATIVLYPLLAVGAGLAHMWSVAGEMPRPSLGASGAIMGLAGMYLMLFPANKVHMAAWMRLGLIFGFQLRLRLFAVHGFWVVAFYIAFDIFYTAIGLETGTAHWAHLGGFIFGAGVALVLLCARLVNARGGDLLSVILGKHAWALVGRPDIERKALLGG